MLTQQLDLVWVERSTHSREVLSLRNIFYCPSWKCSPSIDFMTCYVTQMPMALSAENPVLQKIAKSQYQGVNSILNFLSSTFKLFGLSSKKRLLFKLLRFLLAPDPILAKFKADSDWIFEFPLVRGNLRFKIFYLHPTPNWRFQEKLSFSKCGWIQAQKSRRL